MDAITRRIERELDNRRLQELFRTLPPRRTSESIDCSTNSYLALHENSELQEQAASLASGHMSGNLASRLIVTTSPLYEKLESELASWKNCEAALVFNSGYTANIGILQALAGRKTVIFSDRLNHASIIDGIRLSGARMVRYNHLDISDLQQKLAECSAVEKIIVTDTVFSMDGDTAPLNDLVELARKENCLVIVDEAHATGIFGSRCSGLVEELGLEQHIPVRIGTLSKAVGGLGGFFAGTSLYRDYFVNSARSFIYSTALPHSVLAYDIAAIRYIKKHPELSNIVLRKAVTLRNAIQECGLETIPGDTQIIPVIAGKTDKALSLSHWLADNNIIAPDIRPPTVPKGTARIRFSVHAGLHDEDIEYIIEVLKGFINEF